MSVNLATLFCKLIFTLSYFMSESSIKIYTNSHNSIEYNFFVNSIFNFESMLISVIREHYESNSGKISTGTS